MKKEWIQPEVKELSLANTEYSPNGGNVHDGWFYDDKGNKLFEFKSTDGTIKHS